jgi:hypothetical protein
MSTKSILKILYIQPDLNEKSCSSILEKATSTITPPCLFSVVANAFTGLELIEITDFDLIIISRVTHSMASTEFIQVLQQLNVLVPVLTLENGGNQVCSLDSSAGMKHQVLESLQFPYSPHELCQSIVNAVEKNGISVDYRIKKKVGRKRKHLEVSSTAISPFSSVYTAVDNNWVDSSTKDYSVPELSKKQNNCLDRLSNHFYSLSAMQQLPQILPAFLPPCDFSSDEESNKVSAGSSMISRGAPLFTSSSSFISRGSGFVNERSSGAVILSPRGLKSPHRKSRQISQQFKEIPLSPTSRGIASTSMDLDFSNAFRRVRGDSVVVDPGRQSADAWMDCFLHSPFVPEESTFYG